MNTSTPNAFYGLVRARFAAARGILTLLLLAALAPVAVARTTILFEGFEGNFPGDNGWSVGDANATGGATNYWEVVSTPFGTGGTHTGSWKGYCARTKYGQSSTAPSPTYDNDMTSFMQRNIDLTGCGCATLEF